MPRGHCFSNNKLFNKVGPVNSIFLGKDIKSLNFKAPKKDLIWPNSLISQMKEPRLAEGLTIT